LASLELNLHVSIHLSIELSESRLKNSCG